MSETSISAAGATSGGFRVGRVFSRSFGIFGRNFLKYVALTAILTAPYLAYRLYFNPNEMVIDQADGPQRFLAATLLLIGQAMLWMFLYTVSQAVVLYGAFQDLRGRPVGIVEALTRGLARFVPIVVLSVIVAVIIVIATGMLIVPGIVIEIMAFVALPVCVVERVGPFRSLTRSIDLTEGHRWRVFGLYLVVIVVGVGGAFLIQRVLLALVGANGAVVGEFAWNAVQAAFQSVLVAITYHDLRVDKEGAPSERIVAVFD